MGTSGLLSTIRRCSTVGFNAERSLEFRLTHSLSLARIRRAMMDIRANLFEVPLRTSHPASTFIRPVFSPGAPFGGLLHSRYPMH